jgi:di- and tripeptidase
VWSLQTLQLVRTLRQHRGHILSLTASADERMLFSAGDEGRVYVWDLGSPSMPCLCHIYAGADCGDIYALAFCNTTDTLYLGCKNTSIQVCLRLILD